MDFEGNFERSLFTKNSEKTFIDKILAKDDVKAIRDLIKKEHWRREDLLEVLYLLSSAEAKLLNYGEWDRYIIMKFFVWIREYVKVAELLYDYEDNVTKKHITLSPTTKRLFERNKILFEHNIKFLVDLYFQIGRSSLSIGGTGFMEILTNKYEMSYPNASPAVATQVGTEPKRRGLFN